MGKYAQHSNNISIHAPHEGERHEIDAPTYENIQFQSTLPTRGSDNLAVKKLDA